jgi:hypothetical protein
MKLYFRSLAWLFLLWISPACFGRVITIRVINGKNGQPLVKQPISIALEYRQSEPKPAKYGGPGSFGDSRKVAPGELLFGARPFTFFERIFYPLLKG